LSPIPSRLDPRWRDVASGKINPRWQNLAVKMMMMRILNTTKADPSPMTVAKCAAEVHGFFTGNSAAAAADLAAIFG
jgi:hypothetical protein